MKLNLDKGDFLTAAYVIIACFLLLAATSIGKSIASSMRKRREEKRSRQAATARYNDMLEVAGKLLKDLSALMATGADPVAMIVDFFNLTSPISDVVYVNFWDADYKLN